MQDDQNQDVDNQDEGNHVREKQFFTSKHAIDKKRTILFGHTPTHKHLHMDASRLVRYGFPT